MSAHAELQAALDAWGPLVDLVGDRIRPDLARTTDAMPFVVFKRVNLKRELGLDGSVHAQVESFHVESWGEYRHVSVQVSEAVLDALQAAGLAPEDADPDSLDPETLDRANVVLVDIWS